MLIFGKPLFMRTVTALVLISILCFSCTKTNDNPQTTQHPSKMVKGMKVSYPLPGYPGDTAIVGYLLSYDTNTNAYTIQLSDSAFYSQAHPNLISRGSKTYIFSSSQPRRLNSIQCRNYAAAGGSDNYDINLHYNSYGNDPSYMEMLNQPGSSPAFAYDALTSSVNWEGNRLDIVNCTRSQQVYHPFRETDLGGLDVRRYTDSSFEFIMSSPYYYNIFFDDQVHFPDSYDVGFEGIYIFNNDNTCRTFAADLEDPNLLQVSGQHRFDFTYQQENKDLLNFYNSFYSVNSLMWEMITRTYFVTRGVLYHWTYFQIDTYHPDLYSYYQDICSSYTDSLFAVTDDVTGTKLW